MKEVMNAFEYELLTKQWKGAKGAAYNATFEFCQNRGWAVRRGYHSRPADADFQFTVTQKGDEAVRDFIKDRPRIDVV